MEKIDVKKIVIENLQNHKDWEEYQERKGNVIYCSQKSFWEELLKKLERLEKYDKVLNERCGKCKSKENNICVGMNEPIGIETLIDCLEYNIVCSKQEIDELKRENKELKKKNKILSHNSTNVVLTGNKIMKRNLKLQQENEKLIAKCQAIPPLAIMNEKLVKAIKILEEKTELRIVVVQGQYLIQQGAGDFKGVYVSKEDGELLKEVLDK